MQIIAFSPVRVEGSTLGHARTPWAVRKRSCHWAGKGGRGRGRGSGGEEGESEGGSGWVRGIGGGRAREDRRRWAAARAGIRRGGVGQGGLGRHVACSDLAKRSWREFRTSQGEVCTNVSLVISLYLLLVI